MGIQSLDFEQLFKIDETASSITNQWEEWYGAQRPIRQRWDEVEEYSFATSTRETTNATVGGFSSEEANRKGWSHSTHFPKITNIRDLLSAQYADALFSTDDWLQYKGFDQDAVTIEKREQAEQYVKQKWQLGDSDTVIQQLLDDWIDTGNSYAFVDYINESEPSDDEDIFLPGYRGPKLYRINPRDIVFNPFAPSWKRTPKIIRSIKTVAELHRDSEDHPELGYTAEALELLRQQRIAAGGMKAEDINKFSHVEAIGMGSASQYLKSPYVEVLEFYGDMMLGDEFLKDHVITVIDRSIVLRSQPTNVKIHHAVWRRRRDNLMGMGPLENLVGIQYMLNHMHNAFADVLDESLMPTTVVIGDMEPTGYDKFGGMLNTEYTSSNGEGKIDFSRPDPSILQADFGLQAMENQMEVYAGAPRELGGMRTPGEKTAFEVNQLQTAAYRMFNNKILSFQKEFLEPIVNDFLVVGKRNLTSGEIVEFQDKELGIQVFMTITAEDLSTNGKLIPVGARHFIQRSKFLQEAQQFMGILAQDPEVLLHFSSEKTAEMLNKTFDIDNFQAFEPYIRIVERQQAEQMLSTARQEVAAQSAIPSDGSPIQPLQ